MNRRVLYVSPSREQAGAVKRSVESVSIETDHAAGLAQALGLMRRNSYSAVITDASLADGTWRDVLAHTRRAGLRCAVVVTDRLADDELWAEVLDAGAYDLLAQPFEPAEVRRVLENACLESLGMLPRTRTAAMRPAV